MGQLIGLRLAEPDITCFYSSIERPKALTPLFLMNLGDKIHLIVPHDHVIDCMDLWELACGLKGIPQDKSQRLGVLAIREERRSQRLRRLFHVRTHWMLADPLTKFEGYVSKSLHELLTAGVWNIDGLVRVRHNFGSQNANDGNKKKQVRFALTTSRTP